MWLMDQKEPKTKQRHKLGGYLKQVLDILKEYIGNLL